MNTAMQLIEQSRTVKNSGVFTMDETEQESQNRSPSHRPDPEAQKSVDGKGARYFNRVSLFHPFHWLTSRSHSHNN